MKTAIFAVYLATVKPKLLFFQLISFVEWLSNYDCDRNSPCNVERGTLIIVFINLLESLN